ncbi:hypothetical protein PG987_016132 [Apiospora arundinis]
MSGIEVAGLVLGAFPIALEGLKIFRSHLASLETWWEYEAEFEDFIWAVENESISFVQNMQLLMNRANLEDENCVDFLEPNSAIWATADFQMALKHQIGDQFIDWFLTRLQHMRKALSEIYDMLPIKDGQVTLSDQTSLQREMDRIFFSTNQKRITILLSKLKKTNDAIYLHLQKTTLMRPNRPHKQTGIYAALQAHSSRLLTSLQRLWDCSCAKPHPLGISTAWSTGSSSELRIKGEIHIILGEPWRRQIVRLDFQDSGQQMSVGSSTATVLDQLSGITHEMQSKSRHKSLTNQAKQHSLSIAVPATISTAVNPSGTTTETLWKEKSRNIVKSALKSAMRKTWRTSVTPTAANPSIGHSLNTTQPVPLKPTRQVQFVRQTMPPSTAASVQLHAAVVIKPCHFLQTDHANGGVLGIIETEASEHIVFELEQSSHFGTGPSNSMSLDQFLSSSALLKERMIAALGILRTFLSLGSTQWIPGGLDKQDIHMIDTSGSIIARRMQPFIQHESLADTLRSVVSSKRQRTEAMLFTFGVILLELLYQQSLEQQPFRREYLSNGQPNDYSDLCTAKRWQETVCEDFDEPISEAIRRCIDCAFTPRADLGDRKFLQEVLDGVLIPLEDFVKQLP